MTAWRPSDSLGADENYAAGQAFAVDAVDAARLETEMAWAPGGIRNRALIAGLARSGLRISEGLALELRDVDLEAWFTSTAALAQSGPNVAATNRLTLRARSRSATSASVSIPPAPDPALIAIRRSG